jgi:hypothetical protein
MLYTNNYTMCWLQHKTTPLHYAVMGGHKDIVKVLVEAKAEVNMIGLVICYSFCLAEYITCSLIFHDHHLQSWRSWYIFLHSWFY